MSRPLIDPSKWRLDPTLTFLNHGSFGACPIEVLEAQSAIREQMERSPVRFNLVQLPTLYEAARERIGPLLGISPNDLLFVSNASEGVSIALHSVVWREGDEVIVSQDSYPACRHMLTALSERYQINVKVAMTPFGGEDWSKRVYSAFKEQLTPKTRLLLIDHITSPTALVYPVKELIGLARSIGALSLVDGAHAPGQLSLDISGTLKPSFYVGNAHKWIMSPKSCAILYIAQEYRDQTLPLVVSHGYLTEGDARLRALFDWTGTRDYSAMAVLPETIDWIDQNCDGFESLRDYNNQLCRKARELIVKQLWGDDPPLLPPESAIAHLASIPLPKHLSTKFSVDSDSASKSTSAAAAGGVHPLQRALWAKGFEIPVIPSAHGLLIRISAQAYNDLEQYERLSKVLSRLGAD